MVEDAQEPNAAKTIGGSTASGAAAGSVFGPWGTAIGAAVGAGYGIYQHSKAKKSLAELNKTKFPNAVIDPEMKAAQDRAQQMAAFGYTPQETAAFKQNIAQQQNTGFRQGVNMSGGNLAQALQVGLGAQKLGAFNQFAGADAALHRQNIRYADSLTQALQGQGNLIASNDIRRRYALEQAYGGAMTVGSENVMKNIGPLAGTLASMYKGQGGQAGAAAQGLQTSTSNQPDWYNSDPTQKDFAPGGMFYTGQEDVQMTPAERVKARDLSFQSLNQ
jgi:hypothetical protein